MSLQMLTPQEPVPIRAECPLCHVYIPVVTISVQRMGPRNRYGLMVDSQAAEWVAHLWSHA